MPQKIYADTRQTSKWMIWRTKSYFFIFLQNFVGSRDISINIYFLYASNMAAQHLAHQKSETKNEKKKQQ